MARNRAIAQGGLMKRPLTLLTGIALLTALAGCASNVMREVGSQEISPPAPDKVKVVFMRTSFVAGAIGAEVFEVVDGKLNFIGALPMGKKVVHETTPGKKVFMAYGTAADFMLGDLTGGRIYYSIVRPNWGTGGMIPTPVRADGTSEFHTKTPDFAGWVSGTAMTAPGPEAKDWFEKERPRYQEIYSRYWDTFQRKSPDEKAQRTLNPGDGLMK
jgi:hypothetical protein